jgi:hypothetical protein
MNKLTNRQRQENATAHSSTFGFLPTHKAETTKPKELEFCHRTTKTYRLVK